MGEYFEGVPETSPDQLKILRNIWHFGLEEKPAEKPAAPAKKRSWIRRIWRREKVEPEQKPKLAIASFREQVEVGLLHTGDDMRRELARIGAKTQMPPHMIAHKYASFLLDEHDKGARTTPEKAMAMLKLCKIVGRDKWTPTTTAVLRETMAKLGEMHSELERPLPGKLDRSTAELLAEYSKKQVVQKKIKNAMEQIEAELKKPGKQEA